MRKSWLLPFFIFVTLTFEIQAAVFVPFYLTVELKPRRTHWLARGFLDAFRQNQECAREVAAEGSRWLSHRYFDKREKDFGMMMRFHEGVIVSNKTPSEYHINFPPAVFETVGVKLLEHYGKTSPVTSLSLVQDEFAGPFLGWSSLFSNSSALKHWANIRTLRVSPDGLADLAKSKSFPGLESLLVDPTEIDAVVAVLNSENFPRLKRLTLSSETLSAADLQKLTTAQGFARITELAFRNINFGDEGFAVLANSPAMGHIEGLFLDAGVPHLCDNRPSYAGFRRLFDSPHLSALTKLSIEAIWEFDPAAIHVLADWPGLAKLEYLDLQTSGDPLAVAQMLRTKRFDQLQELQLRGTDYKNDLLQALARNKSFGSLTRVALDLSPEIHPGTVRSVVNARHLRNATIAYDMKQLEY